VKRLFIAAGLVGGLVLACSGESDPSNTPVTGGGSTAQSGGTGGSGGTAGTTGGTAGSGGSTGGTGGTAGTGGAMCSPVCSGGQVCDPMTSMCICPPYIPDHCAAAALCTDFSEDPEHCGDCDTACPESSACAAGTCTAEPTELYSTTACEQLTLALQGTTLYWVDAGAGKVMSLPVAGGTAAELATGLTDAGAIALDDTNIYVVTGMTLSRIPIAGGAAEVVTTETTAIFDVAVQDDVLYYAVGTNVKSVAATADDDAGTVIATAVDGGEPQGIAVDGDSVLWAAAVAYNVEVDSIAADALVKLGASQGGLRFGAGSLSVDGTSVFWINSSNIEQAGYEGDDKAQHHVADSRDNDEITAFEINATTAYFGAGGNLEKAAFGEEDSIWMARNQGDILSVVLDGSAVYWSTGDCKIRSTGL
jgi:hypothetical protein